MIRLVLAAFAGFVAGVAWLMFLGVPYIVPSWLSLRDAAQVREAAATGQADAFDRSELIRKDENTAAVGGVRDERQSCDGRINDLTRVYERALIEALGDQNNENVDADPAGGRAIRPPGGMRNNPAMGED